MSKHSRFSKITMAIALFAITVFTNYEVPAQDKLADSRFAERLDALATKLMKWEFAPGAAIVVVRGDETIFNRGYGMADDESNRPVTPDTVFYIASSTKSFTGLAAAVCNHRGELDLDETMATYLADAKYHAQVDPAKITMRSLLTHTHGIDNNGPVTFRSAYSGQHTPDKLKALLRFHGPASHGKEFRYSNIGYNVAGLALQNKLGLSWKDLLQREIFDPLGMKSTTGYVSKISRDRLAMPYSLEPDGFKKGHYGKSDDNMHAAGGLVTTTTDLANWLRANLNHGLIDGEQVIPAEAVKLTHQPATDQSGNFMSFVRSGYGLGWNTGSYDDQAFIHHFGGFSGFHSHISFMPEEKIGVAVLVNTSAGAEFADVVARFAYDVLRGKEEVAERFSDAELAKINNRLQQIRKRIKADRDRRASRSQELARGRDAYCGTYENEQLGRVNFFVKDDQFQSTMGPLWSQVEVYNGAKDQLRVELTGSGQVASFKFGDAAKAESINVGGLIFQRVGE